MSFRPRSMLAALPVLLALVIAPAANAHCGLIDASVVSGKAWYGLSDAPPTLLFDIADDEATQRDYANEANGTYYVATKRRAVRLDRDAGLEHLLAGSRTRSARRSSASRGRRS